MKKIILGSFVCASFLFSADFQLDQICDGSGNLTGTAEEIAKKFPVGDCNALSKSRGGNAFAVDAVKDGTGVVTLAPIGQPKRTNIQTQTNKVAELSKLYGTEAKTANKPLVEFAQDDKGQSLNQEDFGKKLFEDSNVKQFVEDIEMLYQTLPIFLQQDDNKSNWEKYQITVNNRSGDILVNGVTQEVLSETTTSEPEISSHFRHASNSAFNFGTGDFEISFDFEDYGTNTTWPSIVACGGGWADGGDPYLEIAFNQSNRYNRVFLKADNVAGEEIVGGTITAGKHNYKFTRVGNTVSLYIDNNFISSKTYTSVVNFNQGNGSGTGMFVYNHVNGKLENFKINSNLITNVTNTVTVFKEQITNTDALNVSGSAFDITVKTWIKE